MIFKADQLTPRQEEILARCDEFTTDSGMIDRDLISKAMGLMPSEVAKDMRAIRLWICAKHGLYGVTFIDRTGQDS